MINKLQNQPLSLKRKLIIGAVIVVSIVIVIPLWVLGLEKTLVKPRALSNNSKTNEEALEMLRQNVSETIQQFNELKSQIDSLKKSDANGNAPSEQLPSGPTLPVSN
ncbi:MAG: hypothetical protein A2249_00425 [Candidatus Jacksonbacteria bacterium RIFOXYA2_FULL_44_7]|uniref:Uncharacterized protein n=1 Tax=Candidatus Jacksonbacteria bacterium RIFCSPLOWO2_02_FULL_44_20 TaxID=1798460 RepID=A0A1G2A6L4_9BACT|nr:MAG: hypothetical protein UW40_C0022G0002 [Parcubacteria group bacterium GW2011_GWF2_44_17]OGY69909.1 MAG: hypothetical protein A3C00_02770 [Candidatus Jacksonbacteria bacterium RIFCSPHIGHO2_02_FULL_44_25]OGY70191.1 MAG: hypothetical protein A3E05_03165 [Candidatus Jacksonbacteria bacterium RIFCSPHIGHO2_12_FULL_44_12]OGY72391.1 MAG: hypothetical protein A3H61_03675 [Candidatus Jacksonbacteria bacterium RIFCSPLOWO2_02_FULL_44_20]OGY73757.1 MAG: hypothetical protein A3H07_02370 [Candidatus Jac